MPISAQRLQIYNIFPTLPNFFLILFYPFLPPPINFFIFRLFVIHI